MTILKKIPQTEEDKNWFDQNKKEILEYIALTEDPDQTIMAYTQTFKRSKFDGAPFDIQHQYRSYDIWNIMNTYANFIIVPEATCTGNVHYHGLIISIKPRKRRQWLNKVLPSLKKLGYLTIKPVTDLSEWISYCMKETLDYRYLKDIYLTYNYIEKYVPEPKTSAVYSLEDDDEETIWKIIRIKKVLHKD